MTNSHYRSHTVPLFVKSNLLDVKDMYTLELGVFMYRHDINDVPTAILKRFGVVETICKEDGNSLDEG